MTHYLEINNDEKFINLALNLSQKNIGTTSENPTVGCVITIDNSIVSTGVTAYSGRPHAEIEAINKIGDKSILSKATIYITLEPCSHHGKTSPCVEEIIKYKFSRVVICSTDPNPLVNGKGVDMLKKAGIKVDLGIGEKQSQKINRYFFKSQNFKTPFVTIKIATSLDGKIATKKFDSKWISSEISRQFSHTLRAKNQAILVGANTLIRDNPLLDCRIKGLEKNSPIQIVVSNNLNFSFEENFFTNRDLIKRIVLCHERHKSNKKLSDWLNLGNNKAIFFNPTNSEIEASEILKELGRNEINSVLIEGGSSIITQFIKQNLVDELIWIRSSKIIGADGISAIGNLDIKDIGQSLSNFARTKIFTLSNDIVEFYNKIYSEK